MDPSQGPPPPPQQQPPPAQQTPQSTSSRKRKKAENGDEAPHPAEPRRLRRSHEACARCRSKKIKCDSKHPKCTACATAGVPCQQEDRHRQTLIVRGYTELMERQLAGCVALLKRRDPGFDLNNLDEILAREGIEIDQNDQNAMQFAYQQPPGGPARGFPLRSEAPPPPNDGSPRPYPYGPPGPPMLPPYHAPMPMHYPHPYGPPPPHMMQPPPGYNPPMHHAFQPPPPPPPAMQPLRPPSEYDHRTADPLPHDLSNSEALAKNFGVAASIVSDLKLAPAPIDTEDLAVGHSGLSSRRDRDISEPKLPRDSNKWFSVNMRRNSVVSATNPMSNDPTSSQNSSIAVWLPKDRNMVKKILDVYFTRLNYHRPTLIRTSFEQMLWTLYEGQTVQHDPGYICCVYLVFALATLSELNHIANEKEGSSNGPLNPKTVIPDWPTHEEFFDRALAVKPDLRVSVSSLQALILLQWYLYTERQGRTLWRLVGSMVRLAIELGLHHDPTNPPQLSMGDPAVQPPPSPQYSEEECQLRIRLWGIVLLHDRGTSILLGRPLAIAPSDSNTPRPTRGKGTEVSEHFVLSAPIAEIQADIINSLYAPMTQSADSIMRLASRIIKSMVEFRRQLPDSYRWFFSGTDEWPRDRRTKLVQDITEDQGLTLLKIGITRILLLRALFSSSAVPYPHRYRALEDAIVTSHNIIVVHNQLIRFPDISFFVSPIPLHIAAMVILFGHMSKCERLPREVAMEDVWMALNMLPSFRWRWERKDLKGGHPLIGKLAEEVLKVNLHQVAPTSAPMLLSEQDWDTDVLSPKQPAPSATPPMRPGFPYPQTPGPTSGLNSPGKIKKSPGGGGGIPSTSGQDKKLAEIPPAATGSPTFNRYGYPTGSEFIMEEKEGSVQSTPSMQMWMNSQNGEQRPMHAMPMPPGGPPQG
ncbi:unnamed protein product [Somion occarium]|uniref:Zn(2)-C6 fungal-type domain-containing protein n=1 Tax=Somion occarium TaxID=3059160 RepID=A0ABP1E7J1_9APHY